LYVGSGHFEIEESFGWSRAISDLKILPVVVRLHGPWFLNGAFDENRRNRPSLRRIAREGRGIDNCALVTSPSREVLQAVRSYYGLPLEDSVVVKNPFACAQEGKKWTVQSCDRDRILFVGRFDRRKGGDVVLTAFRELFAANPRLRLTFVGPDNGIKVTEETTLSFDAFARQNLSPSCRSNIDFLGQVSHSDLMQLRTHCFLTVVASQYEIMPYSILEAMALGCPIVATSVGGIPR